ncbi:glycosyltransferase family 2 protein [Pseudorhodobacter sp.]|uniref:glycosyltransferase family 2 protein n=1 Tax=Pseudorhodobacter sp. TaxID=1934400 RepID=UPI0026488DB0|nr:glycosyltransferase family 2 protein [Pseudorhodobacter sp.]MDN5787975.1 glycosyltransferase family 2 protein [Pseudorhodobacter sp.]
MALRQLPEYTSPMRILCVTSVRNEGPFLLEWIAHLRGAGVTDFLIYSNDCEDGTDQILALLDAAGVITHVPQILTEGERPQWTALRAAWKHPLRKACDWALVCDVDEFVNIHAGNGRFDDLFAAVPANTQGMLLPWRLFGSNNRVWFEDLPVTEQFTASMTEAANYPIAATFFKSIFRLDGPFNQFGVHRPRQKNPDKTENPVWVDGSGQVMPDIFNANPNRLSLFGLPNGRALVECNHYSLHSAESFLVKRARGLPNRITKPIDLSYWVERNFNTVANTSIFHMRAATLQALVALRAIPDVQPLHEASVDWHKAKFQALMHSAPEYELFHQIITAGSSQTPPPAVVMQMVKWYQRFV